MRRLLLLLLLLLCAACVGQTTATPSPFVTPFPAPDFTLQTLNGGTLTLSAMRGRWVILNFWATWCPPCVGEMPALQTIADERSGQLALFGVNMREKPDDIRTFMTRNHVNFPIVIIDDTTFTNYSLTLGVPQTVIVSPETQVVWHQFGPINLDTFRPTLDKLMSGG